MAAARVTVMGSFVVDLMARAPHLPQTGETVKGDGFLIGPGGKGSNQGVAAHKAGAEVDMITKIGRDHFGQIALESFEGVGMSTSYVLRDDDLATGAALIMVDENTGDNKILVSLGACSGITEADIEAAREVIATNPVFLTQLETNLVAVEVALRIAASKGVRIILNPAPACEVPDELLALVDILTPNETEASIISGVNVSTPEDAREAARVLMDKGGGGCMSRKVVSKEPGAVQQLVATEDDALLAKVKDYIEKNPGCTRKTILQYCNIKADPAWKLINFLHESNEIIIAKRGSGLYHYPAGYKMDE